MGKAREFWIFRSSNNTLGVREVTRPQPGDIHVIEHSAYLELQQQLARAEGCLRFYAENKTTVIEIEKSEVLESNFVKVGSLFTQIKTIDDGKRAREYFKAKG